MGSLANPNGISSRSVIDVPAQWSADWFRGFIRTQLSQADIRNATAGAGISITGNPTTPATVSVNSDLQALFHQPYVLAELPSGISDTFDSYRLLVPEATVLTVTDGGAEGSITVGVATNGIGNAQLRQGAARSVIGNSTNILADVADIVSSANGDVLWNNGGSSIGFGPLTFLGTVTTGVWNATTIAAAHGGTGQGTYAVGDLLYASTTSALSRLADVASGSFLRSGGIGVVPNWSATTYPNSATQGDILYASSANTYGNLSDVAAGSYLRSGGVGASPIWSTVTLPNAAALGDIIYASATNTYTDLAGNTTTTKKFLTQTGTGSASAAPGWNTISASDLPPTFNAFAVAGAVSVSITTGSAANAIELNGISVGDANITVDTSGTGDAYFRATTVGVQDWAIGNQRSSGNLIFSASTNLSSPVLTITPAGASTFSSKVGVNGATPPAKVTGWGTPTGTGVVANFPGAAATLAQCSQAIAQLINDIKAFGLYGA